MGVPGWPDTLTQPRAAVYARALLQEWPKSKALGTLLRFLHREYPWYLNISRSTFAEAQVSFASLGALSRLDHPTSGVLPVCLAAEGFGFGLWLRMRSGKLGF